MCGYFTGLSSALDDRDVHLAGKFPCGSLEQRGLAGARGAHQVDRQDAPLPEPVAVELGQGVILRQYLLLQQNGPFSALSRGRGDGIPIAGALVVVAGAVALAGAVLVACAVPLTQVLVVRVAGR